MGRESGGSRRYHSPVFLGRLVDGTEPNHIRSQVLDIVQPRDDSPQVSNAVFIGVLEARRVDLVDDCFTPVCHFGGVEGRILV